MLTFAPRNKRVVTGGSRLSLVLMPCLAFLRLRYKTLAQPAAKNGWAFFVKLFKMKPVERFWATARLEVPAIFLCSSTNFCRIMMKSDTFVRKGESLD